MSHDFDSEKHPCPFCLSNERYDRNHPEERYGYVLDEVTQKMVMQIKHKPTCPRFRHCIGCNTGDWITGLWGLCRSCGLTEGAQEN